MTEPVKARMPGAGRVGDFMRSDPPTVGPDASARDVRAVVRRRGVRHVLVMSAAGDLLGIISDRDVERRGGQARRQVGRTPLRAADIMTRPVLTIDVGATLKHACDTMMRETISALPVTEGGAVVGLITDLDLLGLFAREA